MPPIVTFKVLKDGLSRILARGGQDVARLYREQ
jgi:hypothetical protein